MCTVDIGLVSNVIRVPPASWLARGERALTEWVYSRFAKHSAGPGASFPSVQLPHPSKEWWKSNVQVKTQPRSAIGIAVKDDTIHGTGRR